MASFDVVQIAKTTFLPSNKVILVLSLLGSSNQISNNSKWWNPFTKLCSLTRGLKRVSMTTRKDPRELHEFRTFCGGAKRALDPGLNSLEHKKYESLD